MAFVLPSAKQKTKLTGRVNWTKQAQQEAEDGGHGDNTSGTHVDKARSQKLLNTRPPRTVYIHSWGHFFFHYLWLLNRGQEAHCCITAAGVAEFALRSQIESRLRPFLDTQISFFFLFCGHVGVSPQHWRTAALGSYCLLGLSSIFICYLG